MTLLKAFHICNTAIYFVIPSKAISTLVGRLLIKIMGNESVREVLWAVEAK
jgi:hypothetical protein